jgi:hypothetical protein
MLEGNQVCRRPPHGRLRHAVRSGCNTSTDRTDLLLPVRQRLLCRSLARSVRPNDDIIRAEFVCRVFHSSPVASSHRTDLHSNQSSVRTGGSNPSMAGQAGIQCCISVNWTESSHVAFLQMLLRLNSKFCCHHHGIIVVLTTTCARIRRRTWATAWAP